MKLEENWIGFATKSSDKQIIAHLTRLNDIKPVLGITMVSQD
jgi:hypothetical protein